MAWGMLAWNWVLSIGLYQAPYSEEHALDRAAGEGMVDRFVSLEGGEIPRALSWAELRALRRDLEEAVAR